MEDGLNEAPLTDATRNGLIPTVMANFPEGIVQENEKTDLVEQSDKLNGSLHSSDEADEDSEKDALIIDETVPKRRVRKRKRKTTKTESETEQPILHSNPYFNESLFELSQQHVVDDDGSKKKSKKLKPKPKLQEYAQYLGLQPAVQFKCSKCQLAGFETLTSLNEHFSNCTGNPNTSNETTGSSSSSFKLTRKVFLCSACGTYYENWNLYMHMLEFHRRFICLYCLGMFSALDDLCQHIQSKHNCEPQQRDTPEEFFKEYKDPCYLICCECKKLFNEQDNFFYHKCTKPDTKIVTPTKNNNKKCAKTQILPENHVTGDFVAETATSSEPTTTMVRSEDDPQTPEVLPEVPVFNTEMDQIDKSPEMIIQDKDADTMETDDKQTNPTTDLTTNQEEINSVIEDSSNEIVTSPEPKITTQTSEDEEINDEEQTTDVEENTEIQDLNGEEHQSENEDELETRKVPKLSLKLPKLDVFEHEDSDDSTKLGMDVDQVESENEYMNVSEEKLEPQIPVAGPDVSITELELEQPLDKFDIKVLLQKCLSASVPTCTYCNHARKIVVNGKQLGLHAIAEHRYSAIVNSITAEELIPESFVNRIKESLEELETSHFNLESNLSEEAVTFSHVFECFQCRYSTTVHKELYLHNRKMHTKNLLLCIMCKSNFYSYSELICHLCPGDYVLHHDVQFRCCMCVSDDLPSAFRLMVHLRKRHHVCDVCLEMCNNQYKLSNHVWKHKLHHFCYRCGIAYRNKQDITRHLFWKHGTESVLCKKCLQKKWPHVFHFCIPPPVFTCEECNLNFTKAVYLKVHKRIHSNDKPHACTFEDCTEQFVSKKLKAKHERRHLEPPEEEKVEKEPEEEPKIDVVEEKIEDKPKPKVDVYDLPELNLSESSDSEAEQCDVPKIVETKSIENEIIETLDERVLEVEQEMVNNVENHTEKPENIDAVPILESIWDDFKIYQAKKEQIDNLFGENEKEQIEEIKIDTEPVLTSEIALLDHDYFINPETSQDTNVITEVEPDLSQRVDHDYCTPKSAVSEQQTPQEPLEKPPEHKEIPANSDSSSDSDSSSCSCGSNCSCSSSSSTSSSSDSSNSDSSTEEGRRRQQERRAKRRTKTRGEKKPIEQQQQQPDTTKTPTFIDVPILETDLSTTESETDEEFYDKQPLKLAKKLLEEKRNQILAEAGSLPNGGFFENSRNSTPSLPEEAKPKKKSKSKKRKKKKSERREAAALALLNAQQIVAPLTISLNKVTPSVTQIVTSTSVQPETPKLENDINLRASKRRRIPNKFYGYSSDEEEEKRHTPPPPKWRKFSPPPPPATPIPQPLLVPPITIKTTPTVEPITIRSTAKPGELRVHQKNAPVPQRVPPLQINASLLSRQIPDVEPDEDRDTDSNESEDEEIEEEEEAAPVPPPEPPKTVQLYCYCRCPYDEVSEMIGCDSHDCAIEWFHFECVGIMVPPKGQWFCPDCRKRKQQRRELLQV